MVAYLDVLYEVRHPMYSRVVTHDLDKVSISKVEVFATLVLCRRFIRDSAISSLDSNTKIRHSLRVVIF